MKLELPKLNKRESILSGITLAVIMVAFIKFHYLKQQRDIAIITQEINTVAMQLNSTKQILSNLNIISMDFSQKLSTLPKEWQERTNQKIPNIVQEITKQSVLHNITIKKINLDDYKNKIFFNEYFINLEVESPFLYLGDFLESLEKLKLPINVKSIKVSRFENELRKCFAKIIIYGRLESERI